MSEKPEQKKGWFQRLTSGLARSSQQMTEQVTGAFTKKPLDQEQLDQLEEMLIEADLGPQIAARITDAFGKARFGKSSTETEVKEALAELVAAELADREGVFDPLSGPKPYVVLFIGVNGSGKTTTLGKIASDLAGKNAKVLIAAGDTFRAAAVEQLQVWGERNKIPVIAQHTGADSASVIFDAVQAAKARNIDVLIADTAGRLHTKDNLMEELKKVRRVIGKLDADAPHEVLLVLDAGTGQNAISQAKQFNQTVQLTGLALTKLDGTAKGGVIFALAKQFGLPIRYIGVGEGIDDLRTFEAEPFVEALFAERERS